MATTAFGGPLGRPEPRTMICEGCLQIRPWTPWLRCSWECYDLPRVTPQEQAAAIEATPEAFAYFTGFQPGQPIDGSDIDVGW